MSVITLLTDFGTEDEYVGVMKGVILSVNPHATIIDITHSIDPQDLTQAAYMIQSSYKYFPKGSVHIAVVDPGVGSRRAIVAVRMKDYIFLAPDNGVLTLLTDTGDIDSVIQVENSEYFLQTVSQTFHGRDIFAPVAAHISKGLEINKLGPHAELKNLARLQISEPYISEHSELIGKIISIDRFGNLITNITLKYLEKFCKSYIKEDFEIRIGENKIIGLAESYASARPQTPLAIIGSRGYLEIAVNCGNAKSFLRAEKGNTVEVRSEK